MSQTIQIALVGAGMFGGDVHARAYADLQRFGIAGQLARVGLDMWNRDFADIRFDLVAVATRSEASARKAAANFKELTGHEPRGYHGDEPWNDILRDFPDLDVLAVATPDHLHTQPILAALERGVHVTTEKPMCLSIHEADEIIDLAKRKNRVVAVDMHKRYDPDHLRIKNDIQNRIGAPLYGTAYLEEPLEVSTSTFKWVESSDPFSYVGPHWTDLIHSYYRSKPASLTAIGQKKRLVRDGINAYDAVQVRVDYENGMSINYHNNWITPADFEGPVNQGHEIVGADGKVESDQQYRGFRFWNNGGGSRTSNNHFTRDVARPDGTRGYLGYGVDSLTVGLAAICRMKYHGASRDDVAEIYPTAEEARITTAIVDAAAQVRDLNFKYTQEGKGAPVTARFGEDGITIVDPMRASEGEAGVFRKIYERPL
ncbi:Gfo/Idh/MocA family oxidoreductase [Roseimicrobium sp. ORNL1]|uniref:Gfo/Idh/MocA family protein n=1 Tax=Roseimicrobium sp. ORNL1 TaxID=2711231 RepID=UPI0013E0F17C|nr:Gfo/Idh/MocA family oxidoreductase [Roseimicrobium sp. ORNL1]QIF00414.1 Gfo/Idh/MocA family oxidoreductase [Roseimicrobium sp. ORNL1]